MRPLCFYGFFNPYPNRFFNDMAVKASGESRTAKSANILRFRLMLVLFQTMDQLTVGRPIESEQPH